MIYKDNKLTFDELLNRDNSVSIHHQNIQTLGIEMLKFVIGLSPEIMKKIFQFSEESYYQLRSRASLPIQLVSIVFNGTERLRFLDPKIWEIIPNEFKRLQSLHEFKVAIKS